MKRAAFATMAIAFFAISSTSLTSCKKDKDEPFETTVQTLSGSYKLSAMTYKYGNQPEEDMMTIMSPCEKDDIITLNAARTYIYNDAGTKCSPPGDYNGVWDLPTSTKFQFDGDDWVIDSFDGKVFKISQTDNSGGTPEITKMTLNKQ